MAAALGISVAGAALSSSKSNGRADASDNSSPSNTPVGDAPENDLMASPTIFSSSSSHSPLSSCSVMSSPSSRPLSTSTTSGGGAYCEDAYSTTPSSQGTADEGGGSVIDEEDKVLGVTILTQLQELDVAIKLQKQNKVDGRKTRWIEYRKEKQKESGSEDSVSPKKKRSSTTYKSKKENLNSSGSKTPIQSPTQISEDSVSPRKKRAANGPRNKKENNQVPIQSPPPINDNNNTVRRSLTPTHDNNNSPYIKSDEMKMELPEPMIASVEPSNVLETMKQQFLNDTTAVDEQINGAKLINNVAEETPNPTNIPVSSAATVNDAKKKKKKEVSVLANPLKKAGRPVKKDLSKLLLAQGKKGKGAAKQSSAASKKLAVQASKDLSLNNFFSKQKTRGLREVRKPEGSEDSGSEDKPSEAIYQPSRCPLIAAAAKIISNTGNKKSDKKMNGRGRATTTEKKAVEKSKKGSKKTVAEQQVGETTTNIVVGSAIAPLVVPKPGDIPSVDNGGDDVPESVNKKSARGRGNKRKLPSDASNHSPTKSSKRTSTVIAEVHNTMNGEPQTGLPVNASSAKLNVRKRKTLSPAKGSTPSSNNPCAPGVPIDGSAADLPPPSSSEHVGAANGIVVNGTNEGMKKSNPSTASTTTVSEPVMKNNNSLLSSTNSSSNSNQNKCPSLTNKSTNSSVVSKSLPSIISSLTPLHQYSPHIGSALSSTKDHTSSSANDKSPPSSASLTRLHSSSLAVFSSTVSSNLSSSNSAATKHQNGTPNSQPSSSPSRRASPVKLIRMTSSSPSKSSNALVNGEASSEVSKHQVEAAKIPSDDSQRVSPRKKSPVDPVIVSQRTKSPTCSDCDNNNSKEIDTIAAKKKTSLEETKATINNSRDGSSDKTSDTVDKPVSKRPRYVTQLFEDEGVQNMLKSMEGDSSLMERGNSSLSETNSSSHKLRPKRLTDHSMAISPEPEMEIVSSTSTVKRKRKVNEVDSLFTDEGTLNLLTSINTVSRRGSALPQDDSQALHNTNSAVVNIADEEAKTTKKSSSKEASLNTKSNISDTNNSSNPTPKPSSPAPNDSATIKRKVGRPQKKISSGGGSTTGAVKKSYLPPASAASSVTGNGISVTKEAGSSANDAVGTKPSSKPASGSAGSSAKVSSNSSAVASHSKSSANLSSKNHAKKQELMKSPEKMHRVDLPTSPTASSE